MANIKNNIKKMIERKSIDAPMMSHSWFVKFPNLNAGHIKTRTRHDEDIHHDIADVAAVNSDPLLLSTRVINVSTPFMTLDTDKTYVGNSWWYTAKTNDIGTINLEMLEFEDGYTFRYFNAWKHLMMNDNGTYNPPVIWKLPIEIHRLDSQRNTIQSFVYGGYFVSAINDVTSDYDSSDILRYSITLTGDELSTTQFTKG